MTPNTQPGPKTRLCSEARRTSIVDAAVRLFAQNGFRGTTTRQLAAAVGVTEPVLYIHFEKKSDLYTAIIEKLAAGKLGDNLLGEMAEIVKSRDDERFFRTLAEGMVEWHLDEPARIRILLYSALEGHELSELFYQGQVVPFLEALSRYIASRIEEGAFRPVDSFLAAQAFCGMIGQFAQSMVVFGHKKAPEMIAQNLQMMVSLFLRGIRQTEELSK